jgi:hypothetical protein
MAEPSWLDEFGPTARQLAELDPRRQRQLVPVLVPEMSQELRDRLHLDFLIRFGGHLRAEPPRVAPALALCLAPWSDNP